MTTRCLRWIPGLVTCLATGALLAALSGCAALAPPPSPEPLLQDALFGDPGRPAEADAVMAVDEPMRRYVGSLLASTVRDKARPRALADALYARGELQLTYDASITRNAAQAFSARSGNCLSLVLMTATLARELGLDVAYQSARLTDAYSRSGDLTVYAGHVNLVLAPRQSRWHRNGLSYAYDPDALQIDFLPPDALRGLRSVPISEQRVLAMYMNNRAVESLQSEPGPVAYAWAREALRQDPGFWPAYNTLGVVYQRAGLPAQAAAVFEHALAQDPTSVPAMGNLAHVLRSLGRDAEAAQWLSRRAALQPDEPFHFLGLGEAALARGDLAQAQALFDREQTVTGMTHELHFQRARLYLMLGDDARAAQSLREAMASSATLRQQQTYSAKLERLRALARP